MPLSQKGLIMMDSDIAAILTFIFITLKLCDVIAWSWLWVLSPIWITLLINTTLSAIVFSLKARKFKKNIMRK